MQRTDIDALWQRFTSVTRARIALGRAGDALPTQPLLDFQYAHACARDAVYERVDFAALAQELRPLTTVLVHSAAADRGVYLRRPDLGRRLSAATAARLQHGAFDAAVVIADGLSASAVQRHAAPMLAALGACLPEWRFGPVVLAEQARVALGDDIGARLGAAMVVVLIGERPGLTVPNSLGAYLTYAPQLGRRDSERNCISNIHADGLTYRAAAEKLAWLMSQARIRRLTGVELKEDAPSALPAAGNFPGSPAPGNSISRESTQKSLDSEPARLPCSGT